MDELRDIVPSRNHELPCMVCALTGGLSIPLQPVMRNHVEVTGRREINQQTVPVACSSCRTMKLMFSSELEE